MANSGRRNFHVPLPDETYDRLRSAAEQLGAPATSLVREAVEGWLDERERERLRAEIAAWAAAAAGSRSDLDPELEAAGVELLLAPEESR